MASERSNRSAVLGVRLTLSLLAAVILAMFLAAAPALSDDDIDAVSAGDGGIEAVVDEADDLIAAGEHEAAIERLEHALAKADPSDEVGRALLHGRLAIGHYYRRDLEAIRKHAEAAVELVDDKPEALDVYADALAARALYLGESLQTQAYLEASRDELAIRRKLPPAESQLASPLVNIALAHGEKGDFETAERYLLEALEYATLYERDTGRPSMIRSNLAWVYGMRKDYRAAADMLREVIAAGRERAPGSVNLAMRLANFGSVLTAMQRYDEAREALEEALSIQRQVIPDSADRARTVFALGQVAEAQGDIDRAAALYREAIERIDAFTPDSSGAAVPRRALAGILIDRGRLEAARTLLDQARPLTGPDNNPGLHASTLYQLGRLEAARDDRRSARRLWEEAVEALEIQYDLLGGSALTAANFSAAYEPLYRSLAQLLIDEGDYGEAIRLLEGYRNRALLERVDVDLLLRRSEAGQALLGDLDRLRNEARSIIDPDGERDDEAVGPREQLVRLRLERAERVEAAVASQPRLAELLERRIDWDPERARLGDRQRILYYSLGEQRSDLLVVGPAGVTAHRLPPAAEIATLVERFRILVQRPEADPAPLANVSRRLYEVLVAPASEQLAGTDSLLLRADGPLLLLPFAALRDDNDRYLVERYRMRRLHTLDPGREPTPGPGGHEADFSGFAYPGGVNGDDGLRGDTGPLRYVADEVARAADVFGARARRHVGEAATETRARQIGDSRIVHFASHAVADAAQPLSSHIRLAADEENDGRLELWELMADLQLDADLVVLSACETALGPTFAGEGLFGLGKGFAFAGAESVMASLWSIDDASTMYLMETFYRELAGGTPPEEALNRAQQAMLAGNTPRASWLARLLGGASEPDYRHPYYWSPFTFTTTR